MWFTLAFATPDVHRHSPACRDRHLNKVQLVYDTGGDNRMRLVPSLKVEQVEWAGENVRLRESWGQIVGLDVLGAEHTELYTWEPVEGRLRRDHRGSTVPLVKSDAMPEPIEAEETSTSWLSWILLALAAGLLAIPVLAYRRLSAADRRERSLHYIRKHLG